MDAIEHLAGEIRSAAYADLLANSRELESHSIQSRVGVLFGCGIMIALLLAALGLIHRATTRREELVDAMDAARRQFQVTLSSIGDGVITVDTAGLVTFLNPVAAHLTGWNVRDADGKPLEAIFPITDELTGERVENPVRKVLREGIIAGLENHTNLLRADGTILPIDDSAAPIFDSRGKLAGVVMVFRDVTPRRMGEQALRRWEHVFRHAGFGIVVLGPGTPLLMQQVNPAFAAMHGYRVDELIGEPYSRLAFADHLTAEAEGGAGESLRNHFLTDAIHTRKDGTTFPVLADFTLVRDERDQILYITGYCSDVSERKQAEEELRRSEERYRVTADSLHQLIWTSKADGTTEYLNNRWSEEMGVSLEQTGSEGWSHLLHHDDRDSCIGKWNHSLASGETFESDCRFMHPRHGEPRWYNCRAVPIRDNAGRILRWFGSCSDIHEQKTATEVLRASKEELQLANEALRRSNQDLEQFAYAASHDLQEPLRMVAIYSQLLKEEMEHRIDGAARSYLDFAVDGALRMEVLLKDLLAYSRAGNLEERLRDEVSSEDAFVKALANLTAAIQDTEADIARTDLPVVHLPEVHLVQIFQNLIGNALKYRTPELKPVIRVTARRQAGAWLFSVRDNGIGIDPMYHVQIFRIFGRLHSHDVPGTGIGLALCKRLIERNGGTIWVESNVGEGSTFFFTAQS
jgi:PAS domain S-box-containing protein